MRRLLFAIGVAMAVARVAAAQALPAGPAEFAGGTIAVSGEASVSVSSVDDFAHRGGFFNYTDYEHNALRMIRLAVSATWRPTDRFAILTQVLSEDGHQPQPYALYVRLRPIRHRAFDVQFGRIPPVFGGFLRRGYGNNYNPLIGYPLAYQYLTSLRADAIPGNADDLLLMRGRGWLSSFPVGSRTDDAGVPIVSAYRWDAGIETSASFGSIEVAAAVTAGTLSNPKLRDDNGKPQVSARIGWKPVVGLSLGTSAARGEFVDGSIADRFAATPGSHSYTQSTYGLDGEYSRGYWIVRSEFIATQWRVPAVSAPFIDRPLGARAAYLETRYRFAPRLFVATRGDLLTFSKIRGRRFFDGRPTPWDAPVKRIEVGGGVYIQRNVIARVVVQRNWRPAGLVHKRTYLSGQLSYWF